MTSNCEETRLGYSSLENDAQDQGSLPVNSDVTERLDTKKKEVRRGGGVERGRGGRERELAKGTGAKELIWRGEVDWHQAFPYVIFNVIQGYLL